MPRIETLINAYIDANLIIVLAFAAWVLARLIVRATALRFDHVAQLRLTEGIMLAAILSPFIAHAMILGHSEMNPNGSLNVSDYAVAKFLDGHIQMRAVEFETILTMRQNLVEGIATLDSGFAISIVALLTAGFIASVGSLAFNILRLCRLIGRSYAWRRIGMVDLRLSDEITVPFSTRSLRRRYIILPSGMLAHSTDFRTAIAHELQHMRRFDLEWEIAIVFFRPLFFWNPAFRMWRKKLEHMRELACDQLLLERNRVTPRGYADCLMAVCRLGLDGPKFANIVTPTVPLLTISRFAGRRNIAALRERVSAITGTDARRCSTTTSIGLLCALILAMGFGAATIRQSSDWTQDRLMLSSVVNLERLETLNTGSAFTNF